MVKYKLFNENFLKFLIIFIKKGEIMGGANNICSDKTGTLTENKMKVN